MINSRLDDSCGPTAKTPRPETETRVRESSASTTNLSPNSHWRACRQWHSAADAAVSESQGSGAVGAGLKPAPTAYAACSKRDGSGGGSPVSTSEASANPHWRASRQCHPESGQAQAERAASVAVAVAEEAVAEGSKGSDGLLKGLESPAPNEAIFSEARDCSNSTCDIYFAGSFVAQDTFSEGELKPVTIVPSRSPGGQGEDQKWPGSGTSWMPRSQI
jgi:hypothetical protein